MKLHKAIAVVLDALIRERQRRTATVTGTSGTKVVVSMAGSTLVLARLTSYTPVVGDVVNVDCQGDSMLIIGKTA